MPKFIYGRNPATLGQRFLEWLELFDLAMAINGSKDDHKKGHLILNMGDELQTVYRSKKKEDNSDTYAEVRKMLEDHLKPKTVVFTEVMVFRRAMRQQDESANEYAVRLRQLSKNCKFTDIDKEILCSKCQKLNHFAAVCRSDQAKPTTGQQNGSARSTRRAHDNPKAKTVNQMTDGNRVVSESEYCEFLRYKESTEWACNAIKLKHRSIGRVASGPRRSYSLLGLDIDCLVDTGAPINIISAQAYNKLHPKPELSPCRTRYYPYGEQEKRPLPIKGQFTAKLSYRGKELNAGFIVLEGEAEHLMSYQTAIALGIIQMDERDVSALKKGAGHPEGRPTNFQKAYNVSEGGNTSL